MKRACVWKHKVAVAWVDGTEEKRRRRGLRPWGSPCVFCVVSRTTKGPLATPLPRSLRTSSPGSCLTQSRCTSLPNQSCRTSSSLCETLAGGWGGPRRSGQAWGQEEPDSVPTSFPPSSTAMEKKLIDPYCTTVGIPWGHPSPAHQGSSGLLELSKWASHPGNRVERNQHSTPGESGDWP